MKLRLYVTRSIKWSHAKNSWYTAIEPLPLVISYEVWKVEVLVAKNPFRGFWIQRAWMTKEFHSHQDTVTPGGLEPTSHQREPQQTLPHQAPHEGTPSATRDSAGCFIKINQPSFYVGRPRSCRGKPMLFLIRTQLNYDTTLTSPNLWTKDTTKHTNSTHVREKQCYVFYLW